MLKHQGSSRVAKRGITYIDFNESESFLGTVLIVLQSFESKGFYFALFVCFLNYTVYGAMCRQRQKQHFKINSEIPGVFCQFARLLFLF